MMSTGGDRKNPSSVFDAVVDITAQMMSTGGDRENPSSVFDAVVD